MKLLWNEINPKYFLGVPPNHPIKRVFVAYDGCSEYCILECEGGHVEARIERGGKSDRFKIMCQHIHGAKEYVEYIRQDNSLGYLEYLSRIIETAPVIIRVAVFGFCVLGVPLFWPETRWFFWGSIGMLLLIATTVAGIFEAFLSAHLCYKQLARYIMVRRSYLRDKNNDAN